MRRPWPAGGCHHMEIYASKIIIVRMKINPCYVKEPDPTSHSQDRMKPVK
jgi:hypothetical protein